MAKNTSFPPIKDGVKADNSTYSSNQIDKIISEIESEIPVLPEPAVGDINKVIGITSDGSTGAEYGLISIENELPAPSSDNVGKVAKVVADGEDNYIWSAENETKELPVPEAADIGKIVSVVSNGATGAEYELTPVPDPVFNPPLFKVCYDTTEAKYVYYKGTNKSTWEQFLTDVSDLPFWILELKMNGDPNAPSSVSNYVYLYPERSFINDEFVKEYYFDNVFKGSGYCYHIFAHISWMSWDPTNTSVTVTATKLENAS